MPEKVFDLKGNFSMFDAMYIGNTQQTFNKIIVGHFYDVKYLLKNGLKSYSFSAHYVQHYESTTARTYLCNFMTFKVVKNLNMIVAMKSFTKPN